MYDATELMDLAGRANAHSADMQVVLALNMIVGLCDVARAAILTDRFGGQNHADVPQDLAEMAVKAAEIMDSYVMLWESVPD